ncbi:MAG: hypothetical protein KIS80_00235 [Anaerolineales bacterium]|nr:hypothetical protein [Anaerolineales bacterium]
MITRRLLHAIILGLPEEFLQHLPPPWPLIARLIHLARLEGASPATSLRYALYRLGATGRQTLRKSLSIIWPVMNLPGLSYRQREVLIVLRSLQTASLTQICTLVLQDRSNTFRRLAVLVRKDLAIKFNKGSAVFYMAVLVPLNRAEKAAINQILDQLVNNFPNENEVDLRQYQQAAEPLLPWSENYRKNKAENQQHLQQQQHGQL